ncbi:MAG: asparagine--tRNA ligase [Mucinivorans sp.]
METIKREKVFNLLHSQTLDRQVVAKGWVRTKRGNKSVVFLALNDGSTINNIQIVCQVELFGDEFFKSITTGACIKVEGQLVASMGAGQGVEIQALAIELYGEANPETYPLQKKGHTLEFLREIAHLRPRTNTFGAVFRIRHAMAYAIHKFFNDRGFYYWHSPLITSSDAEGAGAMFQVTTLPLGVEPDYKDDFFGSKTNLTVSGQLEGELGAMALGEIYTFGPTFRAENSNTPRHLAEFWMIEPEMAFYDVEDNMVLAEEMLKYLITYALEHCQEDLAFLEKMYDEQGVDILMKSGVKFDFPVSWGADLQSEHERYLVEQHFKRPVIMTDYPKEIKSFYMKLNEDGRTVRGMDVLFPKIGEIIGGSEREANLDKLLARMDEIGIPQKEMQWYLDTRRFGSAPHSGFGLGFERLILFVTGMTNIRDVIPFPRTPSNASF